MPLSRGQTLRNIVTFLKTGKIEPQAGHRGIRRKGFGKQVDHGQIFQ